MRPVVRWAARIAAIFVAVSFFIFLAGEIMSPHSGPPKFHEWLGILLLMFAVYSLGLGWRSPLAAGIVSLGMLGAFVSVVSFHNWGIIAVLALPGLLFLAEWLLGKMRHTAAV